MTKADYHSPEFWEWVQKHKGQDTARLRLASRADANIDVHSAITQVDCRNRYGRKIGETLERFPQFYFPSELAGEQCTSDRLATFHCNYVDADDVLVDLTAGLGIDVLHMAEKVKKAVAVELNTALAYALRYNAEGLGISNLKVVQGDCRDLLPEIDGTIAFIDPARRAPDGSRTFALTDCSPDITAMMPSMSKKFKRVVVKMSPMLDVTEVCKSLPCITSVYILGTATECKEIDIIMDFTSSESGSEEEKSTREPVIHAVTLFADGTYNDFCFYRSDEHNLPEGGNISAAPKVGETLFVPYPSVMKAAPFNLLANRFGVAKFHANTHLYFGKVTEQSLGFPGERLEIADVVPWQSKYLKRFKSRYPNVAVTARNFGMSAEALRMKLGVREGGNAPRFRLFGIGLGKDHRDRLLIVTH